MDMTSHLCVVDFKVVRRVHILVACVDGNEYDKEKRHEKRGNKARNERS